MVVGNISDPGEYQYDQSLNSATTTPYNKSSNDDAQSFQSYNQQTSPKTSGSLPYARLTNQELQELLSITTVLNNNSVSSTPSPAGWNAGLEEATPQLLSHELQSPPMAGPPTISTTHSIPTSFPHSRRLSPPRIAQLPSTLPSHMQHLSLSPNVTQFDTVKAVPMEALSSFEFDSPDWLKVISNGLGNSRRPSDLSSAQLDQRTTSRARTPSPMRSGGTSRDKSPRSESRCSHAGETRRFRDTAAHAGKTWVNSVKKVEDRLLLQGDLHKTRAAAAVMHKQREVEEERDKYIKRVPKEKLQARSELLYSEGRQRDARMEARRKQKEQGEEELMRSPAICPRSRQLMRRYRTPLTEKGRNAFVERQARAALKYEANREVKWRHKAEREVAGALKSPVLTSQGAAMRRTLHDLHQWEANRQTKIQQVRKQLDEKCDSELTFTPAISSRSRKLSSRQRARTEGSQHHHTSSRERSGERGVSPHLPEEEEEWSGTIPGTSRGARREAWRDVSPNLSPRPAVRSASLSPRVVPSHILESTNYTKPSPSRQAQGSSGKMSASGPQKQFDQPLDGKQAARSAHKKSVGQWDRKDSKSSSRKSASRSASGHSHSHRTPSKEPSPWWGYGEDKVESGCKPDFQEDAKSTQINNTAIQSDSWIQPEIAEAVERQNTNESKLTTQFLTRQIISPAELMQPHKKLEQTYTWQFLDETGSSDDNTHTW